MGLTVNQIIILHSHEPDDRPTSEEVAQQIKFVGFQKNYPDMVQLIPVPNRAKLFEVLAEIKEHTKEWLKPLIHFEMHGSPQGIGLAEEPDIVTWEELKEPIREINITFKNKLFVSLATCYGGSFLDLYEFYKPCPFYGYVGPMIEVDAEVLEMCFVDFFTTLLQTDNVEHALYAIQKSLLSPSGQGQFAFTNCDQYFEKLVNIFKRQIENKELMQEWLDDLMVRGSAMFPDVPTEIQKDIFLKRLNRENLNQTMNEWRKTFFHENIG
jgi:hypothetical protein